jgi:hypothetical protein
MKHPKYGGPFEETGFHVIRRLVPLITKEFETKSYHDLWTYRFSKTELVMLMAQSLK